MLKKEEAPKSCTNNKGFKEGQDVQHNGMVTKTVKYTVDSLFVALGGLSHFSGLCLGQHHGHVTNRMTAFNVIILSSNSIRVS
jgi:hypothetical protein